MDLHIDLVERRDLSGEIYRQLRQAIADGRLRPGDCLPPTRTLARSLAVSRTTVTVAYECLAGEGFVVSRVGAGTYVSEQVVPAGARAARRDRRVGVLRGRAIWDAVPLPTAFDSPAEFDFRTGLPDAALFPFDTWRGLMASELRAEAVGKGAYTHPAGHAGLRAAIARHIGISRGIVASADDVIITNGAQQAIDVVARALLGPGDRVVVEDPGYTLPRLLFTSLGARVRGVPVDDQGLVVEKLPRGTRLVYITPSHQYPLGATMSLPRRLALLEWAERNDAAIVEDDYDSEFRFAGRPMEALQSLDRSGRVIYVGSFSKSLLPTLRLGFLVVPIGCAPAVQRAKFLTDWHTPTLTQAVLARFIESGGFARHLRKVGRAYSERRDIITGAIAADFAGILDVVPSTVGLHVTALARSASAADVHEAARRAAEWGVQVHELSRFAFDPTTRAGLVLGYGAIAADRIREGLRRLRRCFGAS